MCCIKEHIEVFFFIRSELWISKIVKSSAVERGYKVPRPELLSNATRIGLVVTCFVLVWHLDLPTEEISNQYGDRNQQVVEFNCKKNHRLPTSAAMSALPRGACNFSQDHSLGKFSDFTKTLVKGGPNVGTAPGLFSQRPLSEVPTLCVLT